MEREQVLQWFEKHPDEVDGDLSEFVSHCERTVRRHAREQAWLAAKRYVEQRRQGHEGSIGAHASEVFVAREVCHKLAHELRLHEPSFETEDADLLVGGPVRKAMTGEAWQAMIPWILDIAREQEHETWREIVRHTGNRARELIREHHLSDACDFDHSRCYVAIAEQIERLVERDFAGHAFPH